MRFYRVVKAAARTLDEHGRSSVPGKQRRIPDFGETGKFHSGSRFDVEKQKCERTDVMILGLGRKTSHTRRRGAAKSLGLHNCTKNAFTRARVCVRVKKENLRKRKKKSLVLQESMKRVISDLTDILVGQ